MTLSMRPSRPAEAVEAADIAPAPPRPDTAGDTGGETGGESGSQEGGSRTRAIYEGFRTTLLVEIDAMSRHLLSEGRQVDAMTAAILQRLESGQRPSIEELTEAHNNLSEIVAPATPRAICALQEGQRAGGISRLLGPTPSVRRLTLANLIFALMFFGLSVSPTINQDTIALSIYDQSGSALMIKLLFIMSAAGLGASFGALFEVWHEISEGRFDPVTESAHWMRIVLGLIAGLLLSEIVRTEPTGVADRTAGVLAEPLLALVGGFSARLVHLVVTRIVTAIEHTFEPSPTRAQAPRAGAARAAAGGTRQAQAGAGTAPAADAEPGAGPGAGPGAAARPETTRRPGEGPREG